MALDKDSVKIFEAYSIINEAPVDTGTEFDTPDISSQFEPSAVEKLGKYKVSPDKIQAIVDEVKTYLSSLENRHYQGNPGEFRSEIAVKIINSANIGTVNATYAARVIQNELARLNVLVHSKNTGHLFVKNVEGNTEEIGNAVTAAITSPESGKDIIQPIPGELTHGPGELTHIADIAAPATTSHTAPLIASVMKFMTTYEINPDVTITDTDLHIAKTEVLSNISINDTPSGKQILHILTDRFNFKTAQKYGNELIRLGLFIPIGGSTSASQISTYERPDTDSDEKQTRDEIASHVSRSEWGNKSPIFGAEED